VKGFFKSKTGWFALLTIAGGVVQQLVGIIPPDTAGTAIAVIGGIAGVLRTVTTKPLDQK
jgi:hypothetical protein